MFGAARDPDFSVSSVGAGHRKRFVSPRFLTPICGSGDAWARSAASSRSYAPPGHSSTKEDTPPTTRTSTGIVRAPSDYQRKAEGDKTRLSSS